MFNQESLLGNNLFAYCFNNPILHSDPDGREPLTVLAGILKSVIPAVVAVIALVVLSNPVVQDHITKTVSTVVTSIADVATKASEKITKREHSVYYLTDSKDGKTTVEYVGRTKDVPKRKNAHKQNRYRDSFEFKVVASNLTYVEARALEQVGMVYHHTINTANKANNQINGIAPKYWGAIKEIALGTVKYAENKMTNEILAWAEG